MAVEIDITPRPDGCYRIVVWTVGPSIERKYPKLEALDANVVIAARAGNEVRLLKAGRIAHSSMAWIGRHAQRGLGVLSFPPSIAKLDGGRWDQRLEWVAPIQVSGPVSHQVLAVWALNDRAQVKFRSKPMASQPMQAMTLYRRFLGGPTVIAGDFNNNPVFHRNDPNHDMLELVAVLDAAGYVSAYHEFTGLEHGDPREAPTRFRPDPEFGRVGHHTDYCFVPKEWIPFIKNMQIGTESEWAGSAKSEAHVPLVFDFDAFAIRDASVEIRKVHNRKPPA
jgi:hypothetical protein